MPTGATGGTYHVFQHFNYVLVMSALWQTWTSTIHPGKVHVWLQVHSYYASTTVTHWPFFHNEEGTYWLPISSIYAGCDTYLCKQQVMLWWICEHWYLSSCGHVSEPASHTIKNWPQRIKLFWRGTPTTLPAMYTGTLSYTKSAISEV